MVKCWTSKLSHQDWEYVASVLRLSHNVQYGTLGTTNSNTTSLKRSEVVSCLVCNARCHWVQYYVLTQSIDITLSCVLACQRTGTDISLFVHVHHLASATCWTVDTTMASSCCATSCRANVSNALSRLACRLALRITTLLHFSLGLFSYICIYKFLYLVVLFWWARNRGDSVQEYLCEVRSLALLSASAV